MTNDTLQIEKLITTKYYSDRLNFKLALSPVVTFFTIQIPDTSAPGIPACPAFELLLHILN